MAANLLYHITDKAGVWFRQADNCGGGKLVLTGPEDSVTLAGPLVVNVSVAATNVAHPVNGGADRTLSQEAYGYDVSIPAGYAWTCRGPSGDVVAPGANAGWGVILRPGAACAPAPAQSACDVPCDFAVANLPDTSAFFPAGCEGCPPGATVSLPPGCGTALNVPFARGGCVRPRFYNGMLMTREDLETELRYLRLKMRLHNRAAGAGVVWGLRVGRNGGKVRVEPGYAVDCCGNDLTVTCPYEVEVATLLADPAACPLLAQGPQRMHLLLEYVECPEGPRPVHGDVCSPQTTLCEMSRVRETVRLRLVPPRDWAPNGPVGKFLKQLGAAQAAPLLAPLLDRLRTAAAAGPPAVPFSIQVTNESASQQSVTLAPQSGGEVVARLSQANNQSQAVQLTISASPGVTFSAGAVEQTVEADVPVNPPRVVASAPAPFSQLTWAVQLPPLGAPGPRHEFSFPNWVAANAGGDGTRLQASTTITLRFLRVGGEDSLQLEVRALTTPVAVAQPAGPVPCLTEACDPQGKPRFSVLPPWSHPDPNGTAVPADPKVDLLAAVYALLALDAGRYPDNGQAAAAGDVQALTRVYEAAWHVLFRVAPDAPGRQLTEALHQLFRDWCDALLYPGPTCAGEPHGVVIGCALVQGGDICDIDPWGGRRWVVHYPLLSYWLEQFGVTPPDVLASRLFDLVCCIACHLRTPPTPSRSPQQPEGSTTHLTTSVFSNQGSHLVFGGPDDARRRLDEMGLKMAGARPVGLTDFVGRAIRAFRATRPVSGAYTLYTTAGFPNVVLATVDSVLSTGVGAQPGRVAALVRPVFAPAAAVPPLLRDFAAALSVELLNEVPLDRVDPDNPAVAPLTQAGLGTAGAVLARDPEVLLGQVLQGARAQELTTLLGTGEKLADTVARAVAGALTKQQAHGLLARGDFTAADRAAPFVDDLARALSHVVPGRDAVARAVDRAARAAPGAGP